MLPIRIKRRCLALRTACTQLCSSFSEEFSIATIALASFEKNCVARFRPPSLSLCPQERNYFHNSRIRFNSVIQVSKWTNKILQHVFQFKTSLCSCQLIVIDVFFTSIVGEFLSARKTFSSHKNPGNLSSLFSSFIRNSFKDISFETGNLKSIILVCIILFVMLILCKILFQTFVIIPVSNFLIDLMIEFASVIVTFHWGGSSTICFRTSMYAA